VSAAIRRRLIGLTVLALVLAPAISSACPNCSGEQKPVNLLRLIAVLMLLPFAIVGVVIRSVRHGLRQDPPDDTDSLHSVNH
jgi:hypothetical protein